MLANQAVDPRDESRAPRGGRGRYRFDQFELDTLKGALYRDGAEIHLRHKTFQVLRFLVENADRTITKQELWDRLWPDSAVTDDALVQCVKDIRRALGDDPKEPRYVRTLPRLGYRFVAPIEIIIEPSVGPASVIEFPTAPEPVPPVAVPPPPRRGTARRAIPYAAVAGVLLAIVASAALTLRTSRRATLPADPAKTSVMVLYLDNESGAADIDWLRQGLADMLISGLSRSERLTLLGRQQLDVLLARAGGRRVPKIDLEQARKLATDIHAGKIVLGAFGRLGTRLRVDVQLYDTASGQLVGSERLVADRHEDLLSEIDLLSLRLAARLGTQRLPGRLIDVMTDNLEAYRSYSLGVEQAHALNTKDAIAHFERAVQLNPRFAMAHARIGYTYGVVWGLPERAKPHLEKAFSQPDRLTPRDRLNITAWHALVSYDYPQAIKLYRQIVSAYPSDVEAYLRLGRLLEGEEQFDEAIGVLTQGLTVDAEMPELYNQLASVHNALRKFDRALHYARRYVEVSRGAENAYDTLGLTYSAMSDYPNARAQFERALAIRPDFEIARVHLANTYAREGRLAAADRELQRYIDSAPSPAERSRGWGNRAWIARQRGRLDVAERHVANIESSNGLHFERIWIALERKDAAAIARAREEIDREGPNRGGRLTRRFRLYTLGIMALKTGEGEKALGLLRDALKHPAPVWNIDEMETAVADALLELGRYDESIAEYSRVIGLMPNFGPAHFGLAQAYDRGGRAADALRTYRAFLTVWRAADADVPQIRHARQRVQALEARS